MMSISIFERRRVVSNRRMLILSAGGALAALLFAGGMAWAVEPAVETRVYPHEDKANCEICHVASEKELLGWFTSQSVKQKLKQDFNTLCQQCHGTRFGHGVGKKPAMNKEKLPLDKDGKITCAVTCHNMHVKNVNDPVQNQYHLRFPVDKLCMSCHEK